MQISIDELAVLCNKLLARLRELNIEVVELPQDYYWDIPQPERYAVYEEPDSFTIGQLSDDWADLTQLIDKEAEPILYNLVDLAAILRAIGEQGEAALLQQAYAKAMLPTNRELRTNGSS